MSPTHTHTHILKTKSFFSYLILFTICPPKKIVEKKSFCLYVASFHFIERKKRFSWSSLFFFQICSSYRSFFFFLSWRHEFKRSFNNQGGEMAMSYISYFYLLCIFSFLFLFFFVFFLRISSVSRENEGKVGKR